MVEAVCVLAARKRDTTAAYPAPPCHALQLDPTRLDDDDDEEEEEEEQEEQEQEGEGDREARRARDGEVLDAVVKQLVPRAVHLYLAGKVGRLIG